MKAKNDLSYEEAKARFSYNPETGEIVGKRGRPLSAKNKAGYCVINTVTGRVYYAHRLAWLLYHGEWPANVVDHINGKKDDNRIKNLRDATKSQNAINSDVTHSATGARSVYTQSNTKKFRVRMMIDKKNVQIGYFKTKKEAEEAAKKARKTRFGDFARAS